VWNKSTTVAGISTRAAGHSTSSLLYLSDLQEFYKDEWRREVLARYSHIYRQIAFLHLTVFEANLRYDNLASHDF
jgi:hypothetical protein